VGHRNRWWRTYKHADTDEYTKRSDQHLYRDSNTYQYSRWTYLHTDPHEYAGRTNLHAHPNSNKSTARHSPG
jgi:hypothetical protein